MRRILGIWGPFLRAENGLAQVLDEPEGLNEGGEAIQRGDGHDQLNGADDGFHKSDFLGWGRSSAAGDETRGELMPACLADRAAFRALPTFCL